MKPDNQKYFSSEVLSILKAVANRMIPEDAWPSATEGGVLTYLERRADEDLATWLDLIEPRLLALDVQALALQGQPFTDLSVTEKDRLLHDAQHDRAREWPVSPRRFFDTLLSLVIEGYYGSPDAGGNREGKSWDMIGFRPGSVSESDAPIQETDLPLRTLDQLRDQYDVIVVGAGAGGLGSGGGALRIGTSRSRRRARKLA